MKHSDSIQRPTRGQIVPHAERLVVDKKVAANLLSVCVRQLDNIIRAGDLQIVKVGRKTLIPTAAIRAYVEQRTHLRQAA